MTPSYRVRETMYRRHGPRRPLSRCIRADICPASWVFENGPEEAVVAEELRRIDRGFEIIYDRHTAPWTRLDGPAHHLYRVVKRGGTPSDDELVLEFSLQDDIGKSWPLGTPRAPGRWVIPAVKARLKDRLPGDPKDHTKAIIAAAAAEESRVSAEQLRDEMVHAGELSRSIHKYAAREARSAVVDGTKESPLKPMEPSEYTPPVDERIGLPRDPKTGRLMPRSGGRKAGRRKTGRGKGKSRASRNGKSRRGGT